MGVNILLTSLLIIAATWIDFFIETTEQSDKSSLTKEFEKTRHYKIINFIFKCGYIGLMFSLLYLIWEN